MTLVEDNANDLEKSLREILPSESHRKKVQNEESLLAVGELLVMQLLLSLLATGFRTDSPRY